VVEILVVILCPSYSEPFVLEISFSTLCSSLISIVADKPMEQNLNVRYKKRD
jgi:hypothetical protein